MLRVTIEERDDRVVFRVEGKLKGPWVEELGKCWKSTSGHATEKIFYMDLDGVDFVDNQGRALLTEMARTGVELIATEAMMRSTVQQIVAAHGMNSMDYTSEHGSETELNRSIEGSQNG